MAKRTGRSSAKQLRARRANLKKARAVRWSGKRGGRRLAKGKKVLIVKGPFKNS